jgi:small subunit ribosomal protein S11
MAALSGLFSTNQLERKSRFTSAQISSDGEENIFLDEKDQKRQYLQNRPHLLSVYATRHNTHINFSRAWVQDEKDVKEGEEPKFAYKPLISLSAGNLGFRHSARKHYDSAFQTASYVMARMQERGLNREIKSLEVRLRGFGAGREAVTKAILGSEGRFIRDKITKVADNTRLKFGGTRSPKPRRLG